MRFFDTALQGALIIEPVPHTDERGEFARTFCAREFRERGLEWRMVQSNVSRSRDRHTLRGLHWQTGAAAEAKLIQCLRGRLLDVIVDLRPGSPTFGQHEKITLDADTGRMLYVPRGLAHGFLTLDDDTWAHYQMSNFHVPSAARGLRWNDPRLGIAWPTDKPILNDRDRTWPDLDSAAVVAEAQR